jgi:MFS family permease
MTQLADRPARLTTFQRLWTATACSNLADGVIAVAAPLLAAMLTRDPVLIAGLVIAQKLPWLLFSLPGGAIVDRVNRRTVVQSANVLRTVALILLSLSIALDLFGLSVLYGVFFLLGCAETLFDNASSALVPAVVADDDLERANGRLQIAFVLGDSFVGPALGGVLVAAATVAPAVFGAAGYAISVLLLALLPKVRPPATKRTRSLAGQFAVDVREGWNWYWGSPILRTLSVVAAVGNAMAAATYGIYVLVAQDHLGLGARGYGVLLALGAIGAVAGGWIAGRVGERVAPGTLLFTTTVISAVSTLFLGLTASPAIAAAMMAVDGFVVLIQAVVVVSLRQRIVPAELLGRVTAVYRMIALGAFTVGGLGGGLLAREFGLAAPFLAGSAAMTVTAVVVLPVLSNRKLRAARLGQPAGR